MVDPVMTVLGPSRAGKSSESVSATQLSDLETEIIGLFVQLARVLGLPRSLAEIYGLLFICNTPLPMDELISRLGLSKGSASQGLKFLNRLGAVRPIYVAGDRRTHYEAVAELRNLATRFLRDQIVPHLEDSNARLDKISLMLKQMTQAERTRLNGRVTMLQSWGRRSKRFLPLIVKMMGG